MQAFTPGTYLNFESGSRYKVIDLVEDVISLRSVPGETIVSYKLEHLKQLLLQNSATNPSATKVD